MVHTFDCMGQSFMLDVESGSLYSIDADTKAVVERQKSPDSQKGAFLRLSKETVDEITSELLALRDEGKLFAPSPANESFEPSDVIKAMCLNVCHSCNLACDYCFADEGKYCGEKELMSSDVAKKALDFLLERSGNRKNLEVDFFGGEPLLNLSVVKEAVAYGRMRAAQYGKTFRFTVTTNAMNLDDDTVKFFNDEMYNVVLSIDGRKDVHNRVRKTASGRDSYDTVLSNALKFRAARGDKQYYVRGTYTALNKDFAADALALNDLGFDQISLEPVVLPEGHALALSEGDIPELCAQYELLASEYLKRRQDGKPFSFFHFVIDLKNGPCWRKRCSSCGAGTEYVAVTPSGDIYPCHQFVGNQKFVMGNVAAGETNKTLRGYFGKNNLFSKPTCKDCWAKYYCSGGCAANAYNFNGTITKPHKISCELMKKRLECALAIYAIESGL